MLSLLKKVSSVYNPSKYDIGRKYKVKPYKVNNVVNKYYTNVSSLDNKIIHHYIFTKKNDNGNDKIIKLPDDVEDIILDMIKASYNIDDNIGNDFYYYYKHNGNDFLSMNVEYKQEFYIYNSDKGVVEKIECSFFLVVLYDRVNKNIYHFDNINNTLEYIQLYQTMKNEYNIKHIFNKIFDKIYDYFQKKNIPNSIYNEVLQYIDYDSKIVKRKYSKDSKKSNIVIDGDLIKKSIELYYEMVDFTKLYRYYKIHIERDVENESILAYYIMINEYIDETYMNILCQIINEYDNEIYIITNIIDNDDMIKIKEKIIAELMELGVYEEYISIISEKIV